MSHKELLFAALVVSACASPQPTTSVTGHELRNTSFPPPAGVQPCDDVKLLYDGVPTEEAVLVNARQVVVQSGTLRLEYGVKNLEQGGNLLLKAVHPDTENQSTMTECQQCHNGNHWHDVQYDWYGDYTYYVNQIGTDPDRVNVLENSGDAVELAFEWDQYPLNIADRDYLGAAIFYNNVLRVIPTAKLWKTIRVERCQKGYFVSLRSEPRTLVNDDIFRSIALGAVSEVVWASNGQVARHPENGQHFNFGTVDWVADVPLQPTPTDHAWPFIRYLAGTGHYMSLQYTTVGTGTPIILDMQDRPGPDGRPKKWQVFQGFEPYESPDLSLEPTQQAQSLVNQAVSAINWH
jgi:hypothetical protein